MAGQRNRKLDIINYLESLGIEVNISKNKARGNKGFFKAKEDFYRIDIAKNLDSEQIERVLVHEFAHFLHYKYDKNLNNLDFIFDKFDSEIEEELINLTVRTIPQDTAKELFELKNKLSNEIKNLTKNLKSVYPNFKISTPFKPIEKKIKSPNCKLLLKYDAIRTISWNGIKQYSVKNLKNDFQTLDEDIIAYIELKSKYRYLRRINSKIAKINKYYASKTELFARSIEAFVYEKECMKKFAPSVFERYEEILKDKKIKLLNDFYELVCYSN